MTDDEQTALKAGLHSCEAFVLRRCQILLASASGKRASQIATELGCATDAALNAINAFNCTGLAALTPGSSMAHTIYRAFDADQAEQLRALLHQSPRSFGKATSLWTLELAAEVSTHAPARIDQWSLPALCRGEKGQPPGRGQALEVSQIAALAGVRLGRRRGARQLFQHADVFPHLALGQRPQRLLHIKELHPATSPRCAADSTKIRIR